jgi:MarR family 2-MHQ and catechol resistance regulon transcriptional repressor
MAGGHLESELKKRCPFESRAQEVVLNLLRSNDRIQLRFARLFGRHGLTPAQYNILRILRGEGKPLPILEIASRTIAVVPGITGLIDRLEKKGLVARERCATDRRVIFVAPTEKGLSLLGALDEPVESLHERVVAHLSGDEMTELIRLLEKARQPLGD